MEGNETPGKVWGFLKSLKLSTSSTYMCLKLRELTTESLEELSTDLFSHISISGKCVFATKVQFSGVNVFFIAFCITLTMKIHFASLKSHVFSNWDSYGLAPVPWRFSSRVSARTLNGKIEGPPLPLPRKTCFPGPCAQAGHTKLGKENLGAMTLGSYFTSSSLNVTQGTPMNPMGERGFSLPGACYRSAKRRN